MEGRRFGVGAAAGLLVALSIVALSGLAAAPVAGPATTTLNGGPSSLSTETATTLTGNSAAVYGVSTSKSALVPPSTGSVANFTGNSAGTGASGRGPVPASFTSDLAGLGQLSSPSRALVLAPIVVAALLGALLYRLSGRSQKEPDQP